MWTPVTRDDEWKAEVLSLLRQIAGVEKPSASPPKYVCDCGELFDTPLEKARHVRTAHKGESK